MIVVCSFSMYGRGMLVGLCWWNRGCFDELVDTEAGRCYAQ